MKTQWILLAATLPLLGGCAGRPKLPEGTASYQTFPVPRGDDTLRSYRIGPQDVIAITVFQEPDLTLKDVEVDAAGNILLPLIGSVRAAGMTSTDLAEEIAKRLNGRFLRDPQVSVLVQSSVSQKVTVEGSVNEAGVYEIKGRTTLIDALAMAKGPSRVAALGNVVIFRVINGQRMGALFNVTHIRRGEADDPEILGNDTIVVGLSGIKAAWRDVLTAAPLVSAFRPFN